MEICTRDSVDYTALDRLGDEIAELSAHLEAATAEAKPCCAENGASAVTNSPESTLKTRTWPSAQAVATRLPSGRKMAA